MEKGRWSCDSGAPQAGSGRSDSTRVVKVNRRKTNRRKTRPYCTERIHGNRSGLCLHIEIKTEIRMTRLSKRAIIYGPGRGGMNVRKSERNQR